MENLYIYEQSKECPKNALKTIQAGKLKGKSDINPMWRIKKLTELFGPCGIGWKICDEKYWTEPGANGEVAAWCSIDLKIKADGEWSDGIKGVGGSMLINTEKGKLVTNDEAYKMAYTDAISVCCKMLGVAADVYWDADRTKYDMPVDNPPAAPAPPSAPIFPCTDCGRPITNSKTKNGELWSAENIAKYTMRMFDRQLCVSCMKAADRGKKDGTKV